MIINNLLYFFLVTIIIILVSAFKNCKPTCNRFIFNTYAYVTFMILGILLVHDMVLNNTNMDTSGRPGMMFIILFILSLFVLVFLLMIPAKKTVLKHVMLVIWLILFGSITYPITERALNMDKDVLNQIVTIFIVLVSTSTGIVFLKPDLISRSLGFPLLVGLSTLIISQILFMIFGFNKNMNIFITLFSIVLFTVFISYDTKRAFDASKKCIEGNANYINYALSLFLDFINLFSSLER